MAKTELTKIAEKLLIERAIRECKRYALEISCHCNKKYGIVDFITTSDSYFSLLPDLTCYEIKVTEQDFNSENGHNLYGDYNYYVIPKGLYEILRKKSKYDHLFKQHRYNTVGFYTFTEKGLRKVQDSIQRTKYECFNFEERMRVIDTMLLSWTTGSMQKYIDRYGIELRNNKAS